MKLIKELKALKESADKKDVKDLPPGHIPLDLWTDGIMYGDLNVYDAVYGNRPKELAAIDHKIEGQEVYLGYSPSKDLFYQGWDAWDEDESDEDDGILDGGGMSSYYCVFTLSDDGLVSIVKKETLAYEGWYSRHSGGWTVLKKNIPDLVDIRLD